MRRTFGGLPLAAAAIVLLLGASSGSAAVQPADALSGLERSAGLEGREFVPGEVVVRFREGVSASARGAALRAPGARTIRSGGATGLTVVRVAAGSTVAETAAALEQDPSVLFAEPNYVYRLADTFPNDPMFNQLWGLHQASDKDIDAPGAWDRTTGSRGIVVAVIDSGVAYDHPDLAANIWVNNDPPGGGDQDKNGFVDDTRGWDFVQNDNTPLDYNGHGTHVAGTIGAVGNNTLGVTGVNWQVSIMPLRAADANGSLSSTEIADAIRYACREGAHVVNGSFSGNTLSNAIDMQIASGDCADVLFVFAAGNSGWNLEPNAASNNSFPCELHRAAPDGRSRSNVLCVAATDANDVIASFSNRGPTAVHLAAPGVNILSNWPDYSPVIQDGFEDPSFGTRWGDLLPATNNTWGRSNTIRNSGTFSLTDSPVGNYPSNSTTMIRRLPNVNLAGKRGCRLDYHLRLETENDPGGKADFFFITAGTSTVPGDPDIVDAWAGSTGGAFFPLDTDISRIDGRSAGHLRFGLASDGSDQFDGAYVDDITVKCLLPNGAAYEAISGTSMATPHVAGVAALLLSLEPELTPEQLKTALLAGVDVIPGLATHVATSGRLNAGTPVTLLDPFPETTFLGPRPPAFSRSRDATFDFTSDEIAPESLAPGEVVTFECSLDAGPFAPCVAPVNLTNLAQGKHTFRVRAIDDALQPDPSPATHTWTVDTVAPKTSITAGPKGTTTATTATFKFKANESGATFQCKLDKGAWKTCKSPKKLTKLKKGAHTFQVKAKDKAGNTGAPAKRSWRVR